MPDVTALVGYLDAVAIMTGDLFPPEARDGGNKITELVPEEVNADSLGVVSGTLPLTFTPAANRVEDYVICGRTGGVGDQSGSGYAIPLTVRGKNLFNKSAPDVVALYPNQSNGTATVDPDNVSYSLVIPLSPGEHTFSMIHVPDTPARNRMRVACYSSYPQTGTTALSVDDSSERSGDIVYNTFTAPSGTAYAMIFLWTGSTYTMSVIEDAIENNDLMVEKSAALTDFEPYFSSAVTVTTDAPLYPGDRLFMSDTGVVLPAETGITNILEASTTVAPEMTVIYKEV